MRPWFTSRDEWSEYSHEGEREYVRRGTHWTLRAALFGITLLLTALPARSAADLVPLLLILSGAGGFGIALAKILFTREWRAAARTFGLAAARRGD
jgi:hypothetical protein